MAIKKPIKRGTAGMPTLPDLKKEDRPPAEPTSHLKEDGFFDMTTSKTGMAHFMKQTHNNMLTKAQTEAKERAEEVEALKREIESQEQSHREQLKAAIKSSINVVAEVMPITKIKLTKKLDLIDPDLIDVSTENQRSAEYLDALALSDIYDDIRINGQVEPGFIRPHPTQAGRYELISGSRRLATIKLLKQGNPDLLYKAWVAEVPDPDVRFLSQTENKKLAISIYEKGVAGARDIANGIYGSWEHLAIAEKISKAEKQRRIHASTLPKEFVACLKNPADMNTLYIDWLGPRVNFASDDPKAAEKSVVKERLLNEARELIEKRAFLGAGDEFFSCSDILKRLKAAARPPQNKAIPIPSNPNRPKLVSARNGSQLAKLSRATNGNLKVEFLDKEREAEFEKALTDLLNRFM